MSNGSLDMAIAPGGDKAEARKAPTVKDLCGHFMSDYSKHRNTPSMQKGYPSNIDRAIITILSRMKGQDVKRSDVATMMKRWRNTSPPQIPLRPTALIS